MPMKVQMAQISNQRNPGLCQSTLILGSIGSVSSVTKVSQRTISFVKALRRRRRRAAASIRVYRFDNNPIAG